MRRCRRTKPEPFQAVFSLACLSLSGRCWPGAPRRIVQRLPFIPSTSQNSCIFCRLRRGGGLIAKGCSAGSLVLRRFELGQMFQMLPIARLHLKTLLHFRNRLIDLPAAEMDFSQRIQVGRLFRVQCHRARGMLKGGVQLAVALGGKPRALVMVVGGFGIAVRELLLDIPRTAEERFCLGRMTA